MIFGTWNPEKIWYQKLINLPTSPVSWSHSTFFHDFTHQKSLKLVNCWQLFKNKKAARFFRTQCRPRSFCSTVNVPTYREAHHLYLGHWVIITLSVARSLRHWASCFTHTHTHTHTKAQMQTSVVGRMLSIVLFGRELMTTAVNVQAILGRGIDNHLLGLRMIAQQSAAKVPDLFLDESYQSSNHFTLSTSQVQLRPF